MPEKSTKVYTSEGRKYVDELKNIPAARLGDVLQSLQGLVREIQVAVGPQAKMLRVAEDTSASSGTEGADRNAGRLLHLHTLLNLSFPPERVVMGLRVCKLWHSTLLTCVDEVALVERRRSRVLSPKERALRLSPSELEQSLRKFKDVAVLLDFEFSKFSTHFIGYSLDELVGTLYSALLFSASGKSFFSKLKIRAGDDVINILSRTRDDDDDSEDSFDSDTEHGDDNNFYERESVSASMRNLGVWIGQCRGLKELTLCAWAPHMSGLCLPGFFSSLTHLTLEGCSAALLNSGSADFSNMEQEHFSNLKHCERLVHLSLSENGIGPGLSQLDSLVKALGACTALQGLDLSCEDSNDEPGGATNLGPLLELETRTQLTHLRLNSFYILSQDWMIGDDTSKVAFCSLETLLADCIALTDLDLGGTSDGNCAELYARALGNCNKITNLNLSSVYLGINTNLLFRTLPHCGPLVRLNLDDNGIGDTSAAGLCELLTACASLRYLSLESNFLTEKGVESVLRAVRTLKINHTPMALRQLNLKGNAGAESAAAAVLLGVLTRMGCGLTL